jgi:hypothetical protein
MLSQSCQLIQLIMEIPFIQKGYHDGFRPTGFTPGRPLSRIAVRNTSIAPLRG